MTKNLKLSKLSQGVVGIVGHAGCGHSNSHLGFIQDDSGGLTAVVRLLQQTTGVDLTIKEVEVVTGRGRDASFRVKTADGGEAVAFARRGITASEARLAQYVVGREAVNSQTLAVEAFGRILGQGAMEVPVALQTAIANASIDTFQKRFPDFFIASEEGVRGNCGRIIGTVIEIDDVPVSVMALTNATIGGLGPNEDIEGNVNLYGKKQLMHHLALDVMPTFVIEGKVCSEPVSSQISCPTFIVRAYPGDDNVVVAESLSEAATRLGFPVRYLKDQLARSPQAMRALTQSMGKKIATLGKQLSAAVTSEEKVAVAAELNRFASEDLGGITFMSDDVHKVMGGVGMIPGTSAVLSLFISRDQLDKEVLPTLTLDDADRYADLIKEASLLLSGRLDAALKCRDEAMNKYGIQF